MIKETCTAVVFGATGFVGSYLIRDLLKKDWQIWAVTRGPREFIIPVSGKGLHWVTWNEIGTIFKDKAQENYENILVFHLAANLSVEESFEEPDQFICENVQLTLKVIEFLKILHFKPQVIYLSSDRVFGHSSGMVFEENRPEPIDPYGLSKFLGEEILRTLSLLYSFKVIIVRSTNLYGPFQRSPQFISSLFHQLWRRENNLVVGNLAVKRNYLFIDDLIHGLMLLAKYSSSDYFEIFHFSGEQYSLEKITSIFSAKTKEKLGRNVNFSVFQDLVRPQKVELAYFNLSADKSKHELNWKPNISIKQGFEIIIEQEGKSHA